MSTENTAPAGGFLFMNDLRKRYGRGDRLASRSFIYDAEKRGDIPRSAMFGGRRVWSRKAVLERDEARFAEAQAVA
jgi:hypothetical protein